MAASTLRVFVLSSARIRPNVWRIQDNPMFTAAANPTGFHAERSRGRAKREVSAPRSERMAADQDWTSVYPTAASFKPDAVPLPIRMGYPVRRGVPPDKHGNLELTKIPNFLHLTPAAIKKHCQALRSFCTDWPAALDSDATCEQLFPIQIVSKEYVCAGPSLRQPAARVVTLTVKLSALNLDDHARKKLLALVGDRYCKQSDVLTITADRCPLKKQNSDYALYLLTVLYHESWKSEPWEQEKTAADMEEYQWEGSASQRNMLATLQLSGVPQGEALQEYSQSVTRLKNEGENESSVLQYRHAVCRVLSMVSVRPHQ